MTRRMTRQKKRRAIKEGNAFVINGQFHWVHTLPYIISFRKDVEISQLEVRTWLQDNAKDIYWALPYFTGVRFRNADDAAFFKLTWGE